MAERVRVVYRDGMSLTVSDTGPAEGRVAVLLHGFPQDASCWTALSPSLHDVGVRTVAPDQRGYSSGARPRGSAGYRFAELVADTLAVADAAGAATFDVVGHDWGATVAWALAAAAPERVRTLTALSVPHPAALRASLAHGQAMRSWYMGLFQVPGLAERVVRPGTWFWSQVVRGLPAEAAQRYATRMSEPGALTGALSWYRMLPSEFRHPSIPVGRIRVPTLMVWGTRDPALGRWAAEHTGDYVVGDYRFVPLEGAGHWLPETRADAVADALVPHLSSGRGAV